MSDNVVLLNVATTLELPPERVLSAAMEAGLTSVVVVGMTPGGEMYLAASSDQWQTLWALEAAKKWLLEAAP